MNNMKKDRDKINKYITRSRLTQMNNSKKDTNKVNKFFFF